MDTNQLRYVVEVAQYGSISAAADKLFVSQPTISKAIATLEKQIGIEIFERERTGVILTKEGVEFLSYAKSLVYQIDQIKNIYNASSIKPKKSLTVSIQGISAINKAFINFFKNNCNDDLRFKLKETTRENVVKHLELGVSEIGFIVITNIQKILWENIFNENRLEYEEILVGVPAVHIKSDDKLSEKKEIEFSELSYYTNVNYDEERELAFSYNLELGMCGYSESEIYRKVQAGNPYIHTPIIMEGKSYSLVIKWNKCGDFLNNSIAVPLKNPYNVKFILVYVKRKNTILSDESKEFLKELNNVLNNKG